jgi:hypothetical protein
MTLVLIRVTACAISVMTVGMEMTAVTEMIVTRAEIHMPIVTPTAAEPRSASVA